MALNKVMLIGNIGRDPEVRFLNDTTKVCSFTLATTDRYKDRNGELKENTEWHSIVAWNKNAEIIEKFCKKGSQIYIEGRLKTREWTDESGAKRRSTDINVESIQLLGGRPADSAPQQRANTAPSPQITNISAPQAVTMDMPDDDLPF